MKRFPTLWLLAALAVVVLQAACGGAAAGASVPAAAPAPAPYTQGDVQFMTGMIAHHAQALEMAALAATHGASPAVQTLAARIVNSQRDEIASMQQWLRDRGQPVPSVTPAGGVNMPGGAHATHHAAMPGMLTPAQMQQLDAARGAEFDQLFLTLMIQHHRGAVAMVQQLFGTHGAVQDEAVFKIASEVNVDQTTEIDRMRRMLADLISVGL